MNHFLFFAFGINQQVLNSTKIILKFSDVGSSEKEIDKVQHIFTY